MLIVSFLFYSYSSGITGVTTLNGNGCTCHNIWPSSTVSVSISGPTSLAANTKGTYTATITGGPLVRAGVNIATNSGVLSTVTGGGLQKIGNELTHISPRSPSGGVVTFTFELTAPANPGNITLYATGNSVNSNGSSSGDQWNHATNFLINVTTSVENENNIIKSFELFQNYPNPFNPTTTISYNLKNDGFVVLSIFNLYGEKVAEIVNEYQKEGYHSVEFDASRYNLSSGSYFYVLSTNGEVGIKKFVYLK